MSTATRLIFGHAIVAVAAGFTPPAQAQSAPPPAPTEAGTPGTTGTGNASGLEEIVVTANKREENLQRVTTSVAAIGATQLRDANITRTVDVALLVPGVQITAPNSGSDNFYSIRGVTQNDYSEHQESPVAVYLDGVYQSQPGSISTSLFDTERVEVLRGPQGLLFGRNSTAGLVQYISAKPSQERNAYFDFTYGSYNQVKVEAASNFTLSDHLYARVSAVYNRADSYFHNLLAPPDQQPLNQNDRSGRIQLLYKADSGFEALLSLRAGGSQIHGGIYRHLATYPDPLNHKLGTAVPNNVDIYGTCAGCDLFGQKNTYGFYTAAADYFGHNTTFSGGATLTLKGKLGSLNLTSISDYTKFTKDYNEDSDGTPSPEQTYPTRVNTDQFSQELRLDNGQSSTFRWLVGLYYLNINGRYFSGQSVLVDNPPDFFGQDYKILTQSVAAFAQGEYDFAPKWTLTVGGRITYDRKTDDYISRHHAGLSESDPVDSVYLVFNHQTYGDQALISKADWSGRVALKYQATRDLMGYASWNRGIKSGGWTQPVVPVGIDPNTFKFAEEVVNAFEVGFKSEWLDHHLRLNADTYYYDYKNYQAFNFYGQSQVDFNADGRVYGSEIELNAAPVDGLLIGVGTALNNTKAYNIPLPDGTLASRRFGQAPLWSQTWQASYTLKDLIGGGDVTLAGDANYRSSIYYYISNAPSTREGPVYLQSFHVSYIPRSRRFELTAFVDNAFDKHYFINILDESGLGFAQRVVGMPRWAGIKFSLFAK